MTYNENSNHQELNTYCRICEPSCGLVATVADGKLTKVKGNKDHVHSRGHLCVKAGGMIDVPYDPDRLLRPMKRVGEAGEFEPVSWDEALNDIAKRLSQIQRDHGEASCATYMGNPPHGSYASMLTMAGFQAALGMKWKYSVGSEDTASRFMASYLLYGSSTRLPKPDFWRTDFALLIGTNPQVSHSSLYSEPKAITALDEVVAKGGRVVVMDPRRSETARRFEHISVRAGADAWSLLGLAKVIVEQGLSDQKAIEQHTVGFSTFKATLAGLSLARCAEESGIEEDQLIALAQDFAGAKSACVYGRTGSTQQAFGTLNNWLQDVLMLITGNLEREGGGLFGWGAVDFERFAELGGFTTVNAAPSRTTGLPDIAGLLPSTALPSDILEPGAEQVRALFVMAGNPVMASGKGGAEMARALDALELYVSFDFYMTDSNRHADYILPAPTFYERYDVPLTALGEMIRPSVFSTQPVVPRIGDTREEWEVMHEICARMGKGGAYPVALMRRLAKLGIKVTPRQMMDWVLRLGPAGDKFGFKPAGLNLKKVDAAPNGIVLKDHLPVRGLDQKVDLAKAEITAEIARLAETQTALGFRLIGRREMKSINSWMHNSARLMKGRTQTALVNPMDAAQLELEDGDEIIISTKRGAITLPIGISEDMPPSHISVPHGWGHKGGWKNANAAGGANINTIIPAGAEDAEALSGMSVLTGVPIDVSKARAQSGPIP